MQRSFRIITLILVALGLWGPVYAQQRRVSVYVIDIYREPVEGAVLSTQGDGSQSDPTDNSGRTHIALPIGTKANDILFLQLVRGITTNANWDVMTGERALVPPFDDKPSSFVTVMLISRFDKQFLANRGYLNSFSGVHQKNPKSAGGARMTGESDQRVKALNEAAQAARVVQAQEAEISSQRHQVVNVTVSIARSYYAEGRYDESVTAYRQALSLRGSDVNILVEFATALAKAGEYLEAQLVYEQILKLQDNTPDAYKPEMVPILEGYLNVLRNMRQETRIIEIQARITMIRKKLIER